MSQLFDTTIDVRSTPPSYKDGGQYVDPDTGAMYVGYDAGGGGDYHPVPPMRVLNEAVTFGEADVTVTHNKTKTNSGSIELGTKGSTATADGYTDSSTFSGIVGIIINPNEAVSQVTATIYANSFDATDAYLKKHSDGTVLDSVDVSTKTAGDTITFNADLSSSTEYRISVENTSSSSVAYDYDTSPSFPYTSTYGDIVAGYDSANGKRTGLHYVFADVQLSADAYTGNAFVEFPSPSDVASWDLATFQRTLDNETVDVYVAESSDGGSTWSRVNGGNPISRNFDISTIASSNDVRIEVEFSRSVVTNNPSLDYAARRYVR